MTHLRGRYQRRELTRSDHDRLFWWLFLPYIGGSLAGAVFIEFELSHASDSMLEWAIGLFFLPWLLVIHIIQSHTPPSKPSWSRRAVLLLTAVVLATFASGAGFGYVNIINALTGSSNPTNVHGLIVDMKTYSASWAGTRRVVAVRYGTRDVVLSLTANEYAQLRLGNTYSREMFLGGLGYYYRWGRAFWK
jgi:uncharacterized membrane protein YfcA